MCGIAGIYNFNESKVNIDTLKKFTDSMYHRGPDGAGYELLNNDTLGFGHRRLSILDLSDAGRQPFYYLERYWIIYNGEVFNFNDIKNELKTKGYSFHSDTDTEVVVAAYDYYGIKSFDLFNGMWAFAIWDEKGKNLILSRDRFGVKPLYYSCFSGSTFAFASETRAFKFLEGFERKINSNRYALTQKNNYALDGIGYTIFEDIYQLLPGHYTIIDNQQSVEQKRWYDIRDKKVNVPESFEEQSSEFYRIFRDACRIRLISDVPVATALSGGLDSSSIYSTVFDILQTEKNDRIRRDSQLAVSAVFPGMENDEREYVEQAVGFTKGEIKWVVTDTAHLAADIEKETELFDAISNAPITAISAIYKGMKREGITVSLDGHGVDEMLYGYLNMVYDLWLLALKNHDKIKASEYAVILAGLYHPNHQKKQSEDLRRMNVENLTFQRRMKNRLKRILGKFPENSLDFTPVDLPSLSDKPYNFIDKPLPERILYFEFFQNTLPALLRNFDRAGMMNSVEIRMPFLDYRLVEYLFSLPINSKIGNGITKRILRRAMKDRMNETIRNRTYKVGIGSPFQYWADHYLKTWFYEKVKMLDKDDNECCKLLLDKYYLSKNFKDLEEVWFKINRLIIQ